MMDFTTLPPEEVENRRLASVEAMKARDREEWQREYQETCDREYWTFGQCCAGCDFWESYAGMSGRCTAAGIMSGEDVLRSMGVTFSSYTPPPGFPFSEASNWCGKFRDDFDWSSLDLEYLDRIGAVRNGVLRLKPIHHHLAQQPTREG